MDIYTRILGSGTTPPPPGSCAFNQLRIILPTAFASQIVQAGNLYYGSTSAGPLFYTNKATFLSDNPGLTLYQLGNFPPPADLTQLADSQPITLATGVTLTSALSSSTGNLIWADSPISRISPRGFFSQSVSAPFPFVALQFNFATPVLVVGLDLFSGNGESEAGDVIFEVENDIGVVFSHTNTGLTSTTFFNGYANSNCASPPSGDNRITGDGEDRITGDGDIRIWA